ncbi:histidine triad (HIT) family protein [Alkalihalobacillus xiaoxiensis]|uniref:Histidine triad (HIT) family protein n=1 Tax=Shouchella xiaoxiensis TaxID=766895 RepID=A0ABS2SWF6_9BACI|nr:HIT family protein [Shouchella xiaoxiensis]MBM7839506.1 histidine triad (HIT) family protein [Shouchella xiaoxiensis]
MEELESCLFCAIAAREALSHTIYEDAWCKVILDINPIRRGHLLVIPKQHVEAIYELEQRSYQQLMEVVQKMSKRINQRLKPKKVGMAIVGFDIDHLHIHLIPLETYHDLTSQAYLDGTVQQASRAELEKLAEQLHD